MCRRRNIPHMILNMKTNFSPLTVTAVALFFALPPFAVASAPVTFPSDTESAPTSFREFVQISDEKVPIKVPTVIELPLDGRSFEYPFFAVKDLTADGASRFVGNYFRHFTVVSKTPMHIAPTGDPSWSAMLDGDYRSYASFSVPENGSGMAAIALLSTKPVTASSFTILLDGEVALPNTILIQADTADGANMVVLNTTKMTGNTVRFPKTTSTNWKVTLTYSQPLRITEISVLDEDALRATTQGLRFLAVPGHDYVVYMDADRPVTLTTTEAGDLLTDKGVVRITPLASVQNPAYVIADTDGDGVPDRSDNCVTFPNATQEDVDQSGAGDLCEDFDRDRVVNATDNCPNDPNLAQTDTDGDGIGDACDGEESRITEKNAWLPWAGMGVALLILIGLVFLTMRSGGSPKQGEPTPPVQ